MDVAEVIQLVKAAMAAFFATAALSFGGPVTSAPPDASANMDAIKSATP